MQPNPVNLTPVQQQALSDTAKLLAQDPASFDIVLLRASLESSQNGYNDTANIDHTEDDLVLAMPIMTKAKIAKDPKQGAKATFAGDGVNHDQDEPTVLLIAEVEPIAEGSVVIMSESINDIETEIRLFIHEILPNGRNASGGFRYVCRTLVSAIDEIGGGDSQNLTDDSQTSLSEDAQFIWGE